MKKYTKTKLFSPSIIITILLILIILPLLVYIALQKTRINSKAATTANRPPEILSDTLTPLVIYKDESKTRYTGFIEIYDPDPLEKFTIRVSGLPTGINSTGCKVNWNQNEPSTGQCKVEGDVLKKSVQSKTYTPEISLTDSAYHTVKKKVTLTVTKDAPREISRGVYEARFTSNGLSDGYIRRDPDGKGGYKYSTNNQGVIYLIPLQEGGGSYGILDFLFPKEIQAKNILLQSGTLMLKFKNNYSPEYMPEKEELGDVTVDSSMGFIGPNPVLDTADFNAQTDISDAFNLADTDILGLSFNPIPSEILSIIQPQLGNIQVRQSLQLRFRNLAGGNETLCSGDSGSEIPNNTELANMLNKTKKEIAGIRDTCWKPILLLTYSTQ